MDADLYSQFGISVASSMQGIGIARQVSCDPKSVANMKAQL